MKIRRIPTSQHGMPIIDVYINELIINWMSTALWDVMVNITFIVMYIIVSYDYQIVHIIQIIGS